MSKLGQFEKKVGGRWRRLARRTQWTIIIIAVILVAIRVALPFGIKYYVNRQLGKIPDFSGRIGDVSVHLYRGAYQIHDLSIRKTTGNVPVPLFSSPLLDLSIQWHELFHGAIVGEILVKNPELNFVAAPTEQESQTGASKPWTETLASLFPFRINKFEIREGQVHFQNFHKSPPVNIYITNLDAVATNLTNSRNVAEKLPAGCQAQGGALGDGYFILNLKMDPLQTAPTFEMNATLTNVDMVQLNDFLKSYGKLDVARGNFSMYTSVAAVDGSYKGYLKVLFKNLDVFEWEKERKKNIVDIFWEGIVGVLSEGFRNHPHDQLAAEIPLSGSTSGIHANIWSTVGSLLKNAFVRALVPKISPEVKIEDVKKPREK